MKFDSEENPCLIPYNIFQKIFWKLLKIIEKKWVYGECMSKIMRTPIKVGVPMYATYANCHILGFKYGSMNMTFYACSITLKLQIFLFFIVSFNILRNNFFQKVPKAVTGGFP